MSIHSRMVMADLPTFSTLLLDLHCVLCSLIDIIEPSAIRGAHFHFVLYSLMDIMVSPKTLGLDFLYVIVLTSLHGHIL